MVFSRRSTLALASALVLGTTAAATPTLSSAAPVGGRAVAASSTHSTAQSTAGTYTSKVRGTWRNGYVRGSFVPVRSFVRNHETWVQGTLTAEIRRSDGTLVGKTTRHDVAIPVEASGAHTGAASGAQAQATCNILHLVLGPLNLNLLGLKVHLNRVVLDITAQSGPGNLLGNLLCAVAHLLDNTSPSLLNILQLSSLLNRVISKIT
jgi:hypothetical protein